MNTQHLPAHVRDSLERMGGEQWINDHAAAQLSAYLDLLLEANKKFNLTAVRDRDQAWQKLIVDSLTLLPGLEDLPDGAKLIDVGSGGGVPGIPVAVALPNLRVTLLEVTGKKARFLEDCVSKLELASVRVVQERAETLGQYPAHRQAYDVAVCRAVGPMSRILEYMLPLVRVGGRVLAMKGPKLEQELDQAGDALAILGGGEVQVFDAYPDGFDQETVIVQVIKDRPTPGEYPRPPGVPKLSPL